VPAPATFVRHKPRLPHRRCDGHYLFHLAPASAAGSEATTVILIRHTRTTGCALAVTSHWGAQRAEALPVQRSQTGHPRPTARTKRTRSAATSRSTATTIHTPACSGIRGRLGVSFAGIAARPVRKLRRGDVLSGQTCSGVSRGLNNARQMAAAWAVICDQTGFVEQRRYGHHLRHLCCFATWTGHGSRGALSDTGLLHGALSGCCSYSLVVQRSG
jgi:hypothetical protein